MSFGERLQAVRRSAGLTQEQFAEELKVSRQAVSKWESCRGYPEIEKILYICNRYGVTLNELFSEEVPLGGENDTAAAKKEQTLRRSTLQKAWDASSPIYPREINGWRWVRCWVQCCSHC